MHTGYESVRYPLSGLVATPEERAASEKHNAQFKTYADCVAALNANVVDFLTKGRTGNPPSTVSTTSKFEACLQAPNYTVFSNLNSKTMWNQQNPAQLVESLEAPHNEIHLMLGGYDFGGEWTKSRTIFPRNSSGLIVHCSPVSCRGQLVRRLPRRQWGHRRE
jgi:tyrosinase